MAILSAVFGVLSTAPQHVGLADSPVELNGIGGDRLPTSVSSLHVMDAMKEIDACLRLRMFLK